MLKITKIFNNNALQAENVSGTEIIILGKGIAFGKKTGEFADEALIEKTFYLSSNPFATRLTEILNEIPEDYFRLTHLIVNYANKTLNTQLSSNIYVSLTDHLYHAIQRHKNHQSVTTSLVFEIKRLYPREYQIGCYALQLIQQEMNITLEEEEIAFITLHIFNARTDHQNMHETYRTTQIIKDILNIVSYHFDLKFEEENIDYLRFITHLQHFALRLFQPSQPSLNDDFLYNQTKLAYPEAYHCVEKINKYIYANFKHQLNNDEQLYLTIHIQRIIKS